MRLNPLIIAAIVGAMIMAMPKRTTESGREIIKKEEGLRLSAYRDERGLWTIGYGHLIRPEEEADLMLKGPISLAKAEQILTEDLKKAEDAIKSLVRKPINQNQFNALASFVFNIGTTAFAGSTLLRLLNVGDYEGAAAEFPRWNKVTKDGVKVVSEGLTARRARERKLFEA